MQLLPNPQKLEIQEGFLKTKKINIRNMSTDARISKALSFFDRAPDGASLIISHGESTSEGYSLTISENGIEILGEGPAGAFYAIQTLKQIFDCDPVPFIHIEDTPDMEYRGFYHDVTRGKVPKPDTLKKLIDTLAYYKMNSLQLYIEHTFPFRELGDTPEKLGCLTPDEIRELDDYCYNNFIEFIPSIATFGHLYELLEREEYKHLQTAQNYQGDKIFWRERMQHHTINPTKPESIGIITSMLDQVLPLFRTDKFNICGDETFDLSNGKLKDYDTGKLYIDFVNQIISHLKSKDKKVMMWGDILLQHPETITTLPSDTVFLNWDYSAVPDESKFKTFSDTGAVQYVCPGTSSWSRFCESINIAGENIINTLDYGYKYGANGMLNTNWGDYGTPCTLELSMYGTVLGAAKAWNKAAKADEDFDTAICNLLYKNKTAVGYIRLLDEAHTIKYEFAWNCLVHAYSDCIHNRKINPAMPSHEQIMNSIKICERIINDLSVQKWELDIFREEILIAAEAVIVMAELLGKLAGYDISPTVNIPAWLDKFKASWLRSNKPSELDKLIEMFEFLDGYNS